MIITAKQVKCHGRLRHRFWGEYSAFITLSFQCDDDASLGYSKLKAKLDDIADVYIQHNGSAVGIEVGGDSVDKVETVLESFGADRSKIGSLKYSVDHGEMFSCEFTEDVVPMYQNLTLF